MNVAVLEQPRAASPTDLARFQVKGKWKKGLRAEVQARQFSIHSAEPQELGGDDSAPNPMELLLAGLEGCLAVVIEVVAGEFGATLESVELSSEGALDARGFLGTAPVQVYFQSIHTRIEIATDIPAERFAAFTTAVETRCPAGTLFAAAANVDFVIEWVRV